MGLASRSQIVGGGANLLAPVTVGTIPVVVDVGPPGALSDSIMRQWTDGAVQVIAVGPTNVRAGVGATETFRLRNGFISESTGADSFVAGRGASADQADAIAIGRGAVARGGSAIVIGAGANITTTASSTAIVIGPGAQVQANGGGPTLMAIGSTAFAGATGTSGGGIVAMAIGHGARAEGKYDLAIGHSAVLNGTSPFDGGSVLIGHDTTITQSQGGNTVIGWSASVTGQYNVLVGSNAGASGQSIMLGSGGTAAANEARIGGTNTNIQVVLIGQGATNAAPSARTIGFTDGTGTNIKPGDVTWRTPRATGNAVPVQHIWQGTEPGASGTTLQGLVTWMTWRYGGSAQVFDLLFGRTTTRLIPPVGGAVQFGDGAVAGVVTLDFGGLGAGVASLRLNGLTNGAGAALGTLANAPTAGDPAFWIPVNVAGTVRYVPAW